jgi:hypothetical protein
MALALFLCWDFSSWQVTTTPDGKCVIRTAESVVLTALAAGTGGSETHRSLSSVGIDIDFHVFCFGQHSDGHGRGMDTTLGLGGGHPLHPVGAAFEFQATVGALAFDRWR